MAKQFIPKVKFKISSISDEAKELVYFCYPRDGWDWSNMVYNEHPELKKKLEGIMDKKKFFRICYAYAKKFKAENVKKLEAARASFQSEWNMVGNEYLTILSKHFEINWRKDKKIVKAYVSIVPINPRDLDEWSFTIRYEDDKQEMKMTAAHEIIHFLYFEKWKEVFPDAEKKTFDTPHLAWKLSEILDPIIMNHNPEIKKLIGGHAQGYKEFENIKIGNKNLVPYFEDLYKKHLKSGKPFSDFLKMSWNAIEKHKAIIEKI